MKPCAGRCPVGLQPTDKFRGESRDPSIRCSCRPEMDPGSSSGKRSIRSVVTNRLFLVGIVPRLLSDHNVRIPDLAVTCSRLAVGQATLSDPVLLIETLSPSKQAKTWTNVWSYTSIPGVQEILVLRADRIAAELLRRSPQGEWPDRPIAVTGGDRVLESIGFRMALADLYARTGLSG
jgi:Uma2 family endonuclease